MSDTIQQPSTYRKMSEPFPNVGEVNEANKAFFKDLYDLRNKHHIRDIHVVVSGSYLSADNTEELDYVLNLHIGDSMKAEAMAAWALGKVQADRQEMVERMRTQQVLLRQENR